MISFSATAKATNNPTKTFGGAYVSDGRLIGDIQSFTVNCDTANNVCPVTVPAPGAAVVFLTPDALRNSEPAASLTFSTSAATVVSNSLAILFLLLTRASRR